MTIRLLRMGALLAGLGLTGSLAGCIDYLRRRDTLLIETGEAVQANAAVQVIDPMPPHATRIDRDIDGERLRNGIIRYRNPQAAAGGLGGLGPVPVGAPIAPPVGNPLNR